MFDPRARGILYAGYESRQICRSGDGGETWSQLPVRFQSPDVTMGPGSNPAKGVLMLAGGRPKTSLQSYRPNRRERIWFNP